MKRKKSISLIIVLVMLFSNLLLPVQVLANSERDLSTDLFTSSEINYEKTFRAIVQARNVKDKETLKSSLSKNKNVQLRNDFDLAFNGFSIELNESDYLKLKIDPRVVKITKAKVFYPLMSSSIALGQVPEAQEIYKNKGEGMVISIIDSGLDLTHKDFQNLDDPSKAKIQEITPYGGENKDTHFTIKVPYGFNFADNSYRIKGYESDHGIHVAGIAGANADDSELSSFIGIDGVASQAQILSMGVFSNNSETKGAQEDDIIAAIEKSIEKGADIINMSLGTDSGFLNDLDPTSLAIKKAKEKGILVVVAAGNETAAFSLNNTNGLENFFGRKDIGVVSSPSTYREAFSVASFENEFTFANQFEFKDGDENLSYNYQLDNGEYENKPYKIVEVGLGKSDDFIGKNLESKVALIKRGDITFTEKANNAIKAGAVGMIVYNEDDSSFKMSLSGIGKFPVFNISNSAGIRLLEAYNKNPDVEIKFNKELKRVQNLQNGHMSDFSSFGSTPDFDIKPEITGVGGQIYSTINNNKYEVKSGTSMAAPYVSGVSAIVYSQLKQELKSIDNYAEFTRKTMMNTAKILYNSDLEGSIPFSVRRQGAGLVQAKDSIENRVLLSYENELGNAAGELRNFDGIKSFSINLKNYGNKDITFKVKADGVFTTKTVDNSIIESPSSATISTDKKLVTVKANSTENVNVTIDASSVVNDFVEGFVEFISQDSKQPSLNFPFMGFVGDYNAENIIDSLDTIENTETPLYSDTRLLSLIKDTRNIFDSGKIFALGIPISELNNGIKPSQEMWSISPNDDGFADIVIPQLGLLRNAKTLEFKVLDSDMKEIRVLGKQENVRRQMYKDYSDRLKKNEQFTVYPFIEGFWDGKVYNAKKGDFEVVGDGQYYIEVKARINLSEEEQTLLFPLKVDTKAPSISLVKTESGADYEISNEGRVVTLKVEDEVGISSIYGKLGNKQIQAKKQDDGIFTIVLPFNVEITENLKVVANDYALNEKVFYVNGIKGNSLSFVNWEKLVSKKIGFMGKDYTGSTTNPNTKFISIQFINKKTNEIVNSSDARVINGKFAFATYTLKDNQQGKYEAFAIEKDAEKKVIKKTSLGDFIYDFKTPTMEFNFVEKVTGDKVKNPLGLNTNNYVEYIIMKNPDGSATFEGTVKDNVFEPNELKLTIGSRENVVQINKDGSFTYTLKSPSIYFDFINLSQPGDEESQSTTLEGLDLAITPTSSVKKGLERTYVINSYIESDKPYELPEFKLTTAIRVLINKDNIGDSETNIEKVGEDYYYTITGFTNRRENIVYVDGNEADINDTIDNGSRFSYKVKLNEGLNIYNIRATDFDGNVLKDIKLRVFLDTNLPNLTLESPEVASVKTVAIDEETSGDEEDTDKKETKVFEVIETWKNQVSFKGSIYDDGLGYTLTINGDIVEQFENKNITGTAVKEFIKTITVEDGDIIKLVVSDTAGNSDTVLYKVRKIEPPRIIEVIDPEQEIDDRFVRVIINILDSKIYDVLKGKVLPSEILTKIENTEEYRFLGWFTDSGFTNMLHDEPISESMIIYPKFEKNELEVNPEDDVNTHDKEPDIKEKHDETLTKQKTKVNPDNENKKSFKNTELGENSEVDVRTQVERLVPRRENNPQLPIPGLEILSMNRKPSEEAKISISKKDDSSSNKNYESKDLDINSTSNKANLEETNMESINEVGEDESNNSLDSKWIYYILGLLALCLSVFYLILVQKHKEDTEE